MRIRAYPLAALAMLAAATAIAAGCGSGSSDPGELAAALPGDPQFVSYIDLDAARDALDLPDDADPADYDQLGDPGDPTPESQLVTAAASALPHVTEPFTRRFEADATANAIDHTQVSAAAAAQGPDGRAAVLQTDQPFDEIADALEESGFEQDGDVYSGESVDPEVAFPYVADLGDGRVVVAGEPEDAEAALAGEEGSGEAVTLLDELDQPRRESATNAVDDSCITGFAMGGVPGASEIELVYVVDGDAEAERVPGELELSPGEPVELSEPEIDGDTVHVTFDPGGETADPGSLLASGALLAGDFYDCG